MDTPKGRFREGLDSRGTIRLLDHLAGFERLLRLDERPARPKLEAVLGRGLTARVLREVESARSRRVA